MLRALLRNQWLAGAAFVLLFASLNFLGNDHPIVSGLTAVLLLSLFAFVMLRWGLLAMAVGLFVAGTLGFTPLTMHPSAWYFTSAVFMAASVVAITAWAFHTAIAGQRLWEHDLFE